MARGSVMRAVALALITPATAARPPSASLNSTEGVLRWINAYRDKPDPDGLPAVVRTLGALQAFKDAETSGAYVGFIAGVLGANPNRADKLITKMLAICMRCGNPAVHTQRLVASEELIVVGASGMYEARCRRCFEPQLAQQKIEEEKQAARPAAVAAARAASS